MSLVSQDITDFLYKCIRTVYETDDISYNKDKVGVKTFGNWSSKDWATCCQRW